jgi:hypothetical protein
MEDPSSIYMFLSSINPFILLIAGIVVGLFAGFIIFLNKSNKTVPILNEQEDKEDKEDEEDEQEKQENKAHEIMSKRFHITLDMRNDCYNIGTIEDTKNDCEYLFFMDNYSETSSIVPLQKKNLDK